MIKELEGKIIKDVSHGEGNCIINFTDGSSIGFMAGYDEPLGITYEYANGQCKEIQSERWD